MSIDLDVEDQDLIEYLESLPGNRPKEKQEPEQKQKSEPKQVKKQRPRTKKAERLKELMALDFADKKPPFLLDVFTKHRGTIRGFYAGYTGASLDILTILNFSKEKEFIPCDQIVDYGLVGKRKLDEESDESFRKAME